MSVFYTVLITLIIYSLIATTVYLISGENEYIIIAFGLGIFGLISTGIMKIIHKIINLFKYHIGKRSIFEEESSGNKYKCKTKYTNYIRLVSGYKLISRYASRFEYVNIPDFSKSFVENSKRNCYHCKHDKECECEYPYTKIRCKHDEFGKVLEFNMFEKE